MAKDQAAKFLEEMRTNEAVREYLKNAGVSAEDPAYDIYVQAGAEAGYDFTVEELKEAFEDRRQAMAQKTGALAEGMKELELDDLDKVAGGYWWAADDSKIDGHELFCLLTYHDIDWSKEHDEWCTSNYIFREMYYKN